MPLSPSYPGVYIEEVASGVRTITGVATSITAFVGRSLRGPVDVPRRISSFGDFERQYGKLWLKSTMSYAVQQYFLNGGTDAVIARLVHARGAARAAALTSSAGASLWTFQATTAGVSGNSLTIRITNAASAPGNVELFDIEIADAISTLRDTLVDVDVTALTSGDTLGAHGWITVVGDIPTIRPNPVTGQALGHGIDGVYATATVGGVVFRAATIGEGGNSLRARVEDATDGDPTHYNLTVELYDAEGDLLASAQFEDVEPGAAWPSPPTLVNTTDSLIDTSGNAPARPANGSGQFTNGANLVKSSTQVGVTIVALPLVAANPGEWGNNLRAAFDHTTSNPSDPALFNIIVVELGSDGREVTRETFRNVSVDGSSPRYVQKVLEEGSALVRLVGPGPWTRPPVTPIDATTGQPQWLTFSSGHDGEDLDRSDYLGSQADKTGINLLEKTDLFNLLVIPPPTRESDTDPAVWTAAMGYCKGRRAMLLIDAPAGWSTKDSVTTNLDVLGLQSDNATNAAMYWPQAKFADPLREYRLEAFPPAGAVAGLIARNDAQRGVWTAPAGVDASVVGARALAVSLTDREHGQINPLGVNVLRTFPVIGTVVWGTRTMRGADTLANEWKYLPVRRLALMIEESLYRGSQWAVFQGNDEPLWAQLRLNIKAYMHSLFRQGAFQGSSPRDAYLVKCDAETTTQNDIDRGIVNVVVGFRPLKPAEFVFLKISQLAGQAGA